MLPDDQLLQPGDQLLKTGPGDDYDRELTQQQLLAKFGDSYRWQLTIAVGIEFMASRQWGAHLSQEAEDGVREHLRFVASQIRDGSFMPGGIQYEALARRGAY